MKKLIQQYHTFIGVANKVAEKAAAYIEAICALPINGECAKEQAEKEIKEIFKQLNGQSKSLENAMISAIYGKE